MARIRTIKPEAFVSESMAAVSLTARWTFLGLLTQADDVGRHRDHPAIIAGRLWALDPDHTPLRVEEDLQQLAAEGMVCRYTGCDGRAYLHIVNWAKHQKIDRPSASRLPRCPVHQAKQRCGECKSDCARSAQPAAESSAYHPGAAERSESALSLGIGDASNCQRELTEDSLNSPRALLNGDIGRKPTHATADKPALSARTQATSRDEQATEGATDVRSAESSPNTHQGLDEPSASGSRTLDPGSVPTGRTAPPPDTVSARTLIGEYIASCPCRPPERFLGHLGREINLLLGEGIEPAHLRAALDRLRAKGLNPSTLASVVNEVMNADPAGARRSGAYQPWSNPSDAAAYEGAL
ncbi:hypothetical protein ACFS5L_02505 [Streptomyces phyllanthi]|uniref:Phage or prophage related protein n=1 Tax=Streptomyces phyllanthi TaxID=1803180 RepID=A0A5N8VTF8_9ACTN|nr:hypothetical protein [Streptomyces phyllanthi]MPY38520.1 hypothetical protein [Streptomyces phyllanthi]